MSSIEKTPYFSQKTAASCHKSKENASFPAATANNSLFGWIFGCYLAQKTDNFATSSLLLKKNHQSLDNLTNSLHYCERMSRNSSKLAQNSQRLRDSSTKNSEILKKKAVFPAKLAEFCVFEHNCRAFVAKISLFNAHLQENATKAGKICEFLQENPAKHATYVCQSDISALNASVFCKNASFSSSFAAKSAEFAGKRRQVLRNVCAHVAKTLKNQAFLVYDLLAGDGVAALELAKRGFHVLALCKNLHFCRIIAQTAKHRGISQNLDVIHADFALESPISLRKSDLALLNLLDLPSFEENFSIFDSFDPDFAGLLEKTLGICRNIVVLLPKSADISELASVFWRIHEKNAGKLPFFSLKCEFLQINSVLEAYVLYLGEISEISEGEERLTLAKFLTKDYPCDFLEKNAVFQAFVEKLPVNALYRIINQYFSSANEYKDSLYLQFLWICKTEALISSEMYEKLVEFEQKFAFSKQTRTFFSENTGESISPKHLANNIEIFTFSSSKNQRDSAQRAEIKLISSQNSPFFRRLPEKPAEVAEKSESERSVNENLNKNNVSSFYSGQILNSLSPHSFEKPIFRNFVNENSVIERKNDSFHCPALKKGYQFY